MNSSRHDLHASRVSSNHGPLLCVHTTPPQCCHKSATDGVPGDTRNVIWKNYYAPLRLRMLLTRSGLCPSPPNLPLGVFVLPSAIDRYRSQTSHSINTIQTLKGTNGFFLFFRSEVTRTSISRPARTSRISEGGAAGAGVAQATWIESQQNNELQ